MHLIETIEGNKMHTMSRRSLGLSIFAAAVVGALFAGGSAVSANAATTDDSTTTHTVVGLHSVGFNASVAEANGFKIVTDANGKQTSVPVTAAAKEAVAHANTAAIAKAGGGFHTNTIVSGDCGTSDIVASRLGSASVKTVTGFEVYLPTGIRYWHVSLKNTYGQLFDQDYSGGPTGYAWHDSKSKNIVDNFTFRAQVTPGSYAILINGDVCASGAPIA